MKKIYVKYVFCDALPKRWDACIRSENSQPERYEIRALSYQDPDIRQADICGNNPFQLMGCMV